MFSALLAVKSYRLTNLFYSRTRNGINKNN